MGAGGEWEGGDRREELAPACLSGFSFSSAVDVEIDGRPLWLLEPGWLGRRGLESEWMTQTDGLLFSEVPKGDDC